MAVTDIREKVDAAASPLIAGGNKPQPITTLRDWLDHLAARDRLAVIRPEVSLKYELAAIAKRFDGHKATLFPRPGGHAMPVISGLVSDRQWIADAMGVDSNEVLSRFQDAMLNPLPWKEVKSAPAQEVVHREIDLGKQLPLPTHNEHDNGAYITAGLCIARNPATGVQNVSLHRLQLSGPDRLGALLLPRHTHMFYEMAERSGQPLDVAIVIGVDPLTLLSSQAIAPIDFDELTIAGALHGTPLSVVKCITNELRVPAEAEIVIEGRVLPKVRELEGPFGEFPQYYGERPSVTSSKLPPSRSVRMRYSTPSSAADSSICCSAVFRAKRLCWRICAAAFRTYATCISRRGGVCRYHLYVQIAKRQEGEAKNVMMGAFAGHYDVKQVIVVDEDVDIHNPTEVEWAVATRFQADQDLVIVPESQGSKLDPSTRNGVGAKMGMDATKPLDADEMKFKRIRVPGEDKIDLNKVVGPVPGQSWRRALGQ